MTDRKDIRQFGSFDGKDNRKSVVELFTRMGDGLEESIAACRRARFLQWLIKVGGGPFEKAPCLVSPCTAVEAYLLFVNITGCMGIEIEDAAKLLEEAINHSKRFMELFRAIQ
jgi:hypothetical protein